MAAVGHRAAERLLHLQQQPVAVEVAAAAVADADGDAQSGGGRPAAPRFQLRHGAVEIGLRQDQREPGGAVGEGQLRERRQLPHQVRQARRAVVGGGLRGQQDAERDAEVGMVGGGALQLGPQPVPELVLRLQTVVVAGGCAAIARDGRRGGSGGRCREAGRGRYAGSDRYAVSDGHAVSGGYVGRDGNAGGRRYAGRRRYADSGG